MKGADGRFYPVYSAVTAYMHPVIMELMECRLYRNEPVVRHICQNITMITSYHIFCKYKLSTRRRHSCQPCNLLATHIFYVHQWCWNYEWNRLCAVNTANVSDIMSYWCIYTLNEEKCVMKCKWRLSDHSSGIFITSPNGRMCNNSSFSISTIKDITQEIIIEGLGKKKCQSLHDWGKNTGEIQSVAPVRGDKHTLEAAGRCAGCWSDDTEDECFYKKLRFAVSQKKLYDNNSANLRADVLLLFLCSPWYHRRERKMIS